MTTIRTSRADRNWLSISDDTAQLYLGTDHPEPFELPADGSLTLTPPTPQDWDAILKVSSNDTPLTLTRVRIAQGRENVLDFNRYASYVLVEGDLGWGGGEGDQVVTIKGGSRYITVAGTIHSRGRNGDVVLDAWSDQSSDLVFNIDLVGLKRADGQPVTVILGRFNRRGVCLPPNARILWVKSVGYWAYYWLKLAAVKLGVMR